MPMSEREVLSEYKIFETQEFQKRFAKVPPSQTKFLKQKLQNYVYPQLIRAKSENHILQIMM